ncbi:MAG: peptide deformylase [Candidatus Bathyarchaeota archaeon]|nr:peptide deformylase [Candidatus Bathyarchaeota archaeon]
MIRPILQLGDPILRKKSLPVQDIGRWDLHCLIEDLSDTLQDANRRFAYGRGIAAPQIGELKSVVFVDTPDFKSALVNPEIVWLSPAMFEVWDSCFSFNVSFFVLVDRLWSIKVEYSDWKGNRQALEAEGELSELLQHEIDHLDGILAIDRMKDGEAMIMRSEWERNFKV